MFYDNYLKLCNLINKTPSAVAEEMGLKRSSVTRWKKGTKPTDATLQKIAEYFQVSVGSLKNDNVSYEPHENRGVITDTDIKAAFWGGDKDLTKEDMDALWQDVQEYARFKAEQRKKKGK